MAAASKVAENKVNTYSVTFDDKTYDESTYARQIADLYVPIIRNKSRSKFSLHNMDKYIKQMDHPTLMGSIAMSFQMRF